ncbi:MAG: DUF423 domain-containing protein [Bacteroidetes bacterium]|nr:MAG: DUF423 domain-containing protein [Bacteroidota bacterium]TNE97308.1 MAG: DUF423 domain-containing protein [Bacteroidota bacterium]
MDKRVVLFSAIFILAGVILGAFGAHTLKALIVEKKLVSFETGVRYQLIMGVALLAISLWNENKIDLKWFNRLLISGTLLFSCSIYFLAIEDLLGVSLSFLGPITPLGGSLMIIAWIIFIQRIVKS